MKGARRTTPSVPLAAANDRATKTLFAMVSSELRGSHGHEAVQDDAAALVMCQTGESWTTVHVRAVPEVPIEQEWVRFCCVNETGDCRVIVTSKAE